MLGAGAPTVVVSGCDEKGPWHGSEISRNLRRLAFSMADALTGKPVTAADRCGKVTGFIS